MANDLSSLDDTSRAALGRVVFHATCVVHHWQELGTAADFYREIAKLEEALTAWKRGWQQEVSRG